MSSVGYWGYDGYYDGYYGSDSSFQFVVATGVLIWLWVMLFDLPASYSLAVSPVPGFRSMQQILLQRVLLSVNCVWILFTFCSAIAAAADAHETLGFAGCDSIYSCLPPSDQNTLNAAIVFDFFLLFLLCYQTFVGFQELKVARNNAPLQQDMLQNQGYAQSF